MSKGEYEKMHKKYDADPATYWDWAVKKFGDSKSSFKAILHCSGPIELNQYKDFIHRKALDQVISGSKGKKVLDVGCGIGRFSMLFGEKGAQVTGIDLSKEMVKTAKNNVKLRNLNCDFKNMNVINLEFHDNYFDLVNSVVVLMHIKKFHDFKASLHEMIRVTKPNGQIVILDEIPIKKSTKGQVTVHRTLNTYRKVIEEAGAKIERVKFVAISPYGVTLLLISKINFSFIRKIITYICYAVFKFIDLYFTKIPLIQEHRFSEEMLLIIRKKSIIRK